MWKKHPGIIRVVDDDVAEDGSRFLVLELLHGVPLDQWCVDGGNRMPLSIVLSIGDALLDVLAATHRHWDEVHRDLKPANLYSGLLAKAC